MHSGKFICIDGANGSGKSTIIKELENLFDDNSLEVVATKEPTSSKLGQFIRAEQDNFEGPALACLVTADRYGHIKEIIRPNLEQGKLVVTDRYFPSSLVYQVIDGLNTDYIWTLNKHIIWPDLFVHVVATPETIISRLSQRNTKTRFENLNHLHQELILYQNVFHTLSKKGFNVLKINNNQQSIFESAMTVYKAILRL